MNEMVERVARAIGGEVEWHFPETTCSKAQLARRDEHRRLARAAIAVMREPTEDMVMASNTFPIFTKLLEIGNSERIWQAMIDAALKD